MFTPSFYPLDSVKSLIIETGFGTAERWLVPAGLRATAR